MLWARNPHTWVRGEYSTQPRHPLASSASTNEQHAHRIRHVSCAMSGPGPRGGSDLTINDSLDAMEGKIDEESVVWRLQDLRQREEAIRLEREELELELLHVSQARALKRQERIFRERQEQAMKEWSENGAGEQPAGEATGKASGEAEGGSGAKRRRKRRGKGKKLGRTSAMASAAATQRKVEQLSQKGTASSLNNGGSGAADTWRQESSIATPGSSVHVLPFDPDDMCVLPKPIFLLSDCTGESAARTVKAALGQFEMYSKMSCQANLIIFRFLSDERKVYNIVQRAAEEEALIVYTLVDVTMLRSVKTACRLYDVKALDLWGDLLDVMETHLQQARLGVPLARMNRSEQLPADYFRMIEAVEYTRKMDDGANPDQWKHADLLLLGVSRSGKTPLSIYLGQRGYKVANLPLVAGLPPPPQLFQINQHKIIGLIIDSQLLAQVRAARMGTMGVEQSQFNYSDMNKIRSELDWAQEMYRQNPLWPVLDVTFRGVEETAARILRIMSDRFGDLHPLVAEGHTVLTG